MKICLVDPQAATVTFVDKAEEDIPALCREWCGGEVDHFTMAATAGYYITGFVFEHGLYQESPDMFGIVGHHELLAGRGVLVASEGPDTIDWPWPEDFTRQRIGFLSFVDIRQSLRAKTGSKVIGAIGGNWLQ